jgi:hypothetical protein
MNGRPVSTGDLCVYSKPVPRLQAANALDALFRGVCTVVAFYQIECGDKIEVFAEVVLVNTVGRIHSMFIITTAGLNEARGRALDRVLAQEVSTTFIHTDSILVKLHVVPHVDLTKRELLCAIPMWETR